MTDINDVQLQGGGEEKETDKPNVPFAHRESKVQVSALACHLRTDARGEKHCMHSHSDANKPADVELWTAFVCICRNILCASALGFKAFLDLPQKWGMTQTSQLFWYNINIIIE